MENTNLGSEYCCFCDKNISYSENKDQPKKKIIVYKCPGCERKYCSVNCCSGHKQKYHCSGSRVRTPYVKLSEFGQAQFLDDYFFLEDVNQKLETISRISSKLPRTSHPANANKIEGNKSQKKRGKNRRNNRKPQNRCDHMKSDQPQKTIT